MGGGSRVKFSGSKPHRKPVVYYEEEAQERSQHRFPTTPHCRYQEDEGLGPAHQPDEEAIPLHA
jgi:hypothetical protein